MSANAIEMIGITKVFPGVVANDAVDFYVREGEVHALLGENGAGKSTLMSILFGLYAADSGVIKIRGEAVRIANPNDATRLGIGMVHQHFKLIHNFTVAQNIVLGMEPRTRLGEIDIKTVEARVAELSRIYGLQVDPRALIEDCSVGVQQRVEILKILYRNADILIFDEPTAVLTPQEVDELLSIFSRLREEGKTIILITHKLREIKLAAARCTVLRRGRLVGVVDVAAASEESLAEMMVGRAVRLELDKAVAKPGPVVLALEDVTVGSGRGRPALDGLSLEVRAGEIVGVAGVDGNGQTELVAALAGLLPLKSGRILFKGNDIARLSIRTRAEQGIGIVSEDRHRYGLVLDFRLDENLALRAFREPPFSGSLGFLDFRAMAAHAQGLVEEFDIRAGNGAATPVRAMSGGNQQKAVIAREIDRSPDLLVVAQPTRGLDVGAIEYIHGRILAERDKGRAILLISFELDEIMNLCDRIAAISGGKILGVVDAQNADERNIGAMMAGHKTGQQGTVHA